MASLFLFETNVMTRPDFPVVLDKLINPLLMTFTTRQPYLPFQALTLARKLVLTFFIALSQIGPLLTQQNPLEQAGKEVQGQQLDRLDAISRATDQEVARLLGLELSPFAADGATMQELKSSMRRWLVDNTVRADPDVRNAVGRVIERRRADVPAGAQGAR